MVLPTQLKVGNSYPRLGHLADIGPHCLKLRRNVFPFSFHIFGLYYQVQLKENNWWGSTQDSLQENSLLRFPNVNFMQNTVHALLVSQDDTQILILLVTTSRILWTQIPVPKQCFVHRSSVETWQICHYCSSAAWIYRWLPPVSKTWNGDLHSRAT